LILIEFEMEIKISSGALRYIQSKGAKSIAVVLVDVETGDSIGAARDIEVKFETPEDTRNYYLEHSQGIDVYVDRRLRLTGKVVIKKQGFWKISSLYADGLQIPL